MLIYIYICSPPKEPTKTASSVVFTQKTVVFKYSLHYIEIICKYIICICIYIYTYMVTPHQGLP